METIAKALQRAKQAPPIPDLVMSSGRGLPLRHQLRHSAGNAPQQTAEVTKLDERLLRDNRIVAFDPQREPTRYYDLLRNQVVNYQRKPGRQVVAVSGPTLGCGATVTAVNLAFSYARMRALRVIFLDASDDGGARRLLGLPVSPLQDDGMKLDADMPTLVEVRNVSLCVTTSFPDVIEGLPVRGQPEPKATIVVIDLPPLLTSDGIMSYLNKSDSVIMVAMEGRTTPAEIDSCKTLLGRRDGIQYVLNSCGSHGL